MVLATALSLVMLGLGGFGGIINVSYANSMIHNTSWVPAHFHNLRGAVVIMYFAINYEMWPRITGKPLRSKELAPGTAIRSHSMRSPPSWEPHSTHTACASSSAERRSISPSGHACS